MFNPLNWSGNALVALVLTVITAVGGVIFTLTTQRNEARNLVAGAGSELAECLVAGKEQNAKVAELKTLSQDQQARATAAVKVGAALRAEAERHTQVLLTAAVPAECPAAIRWGAHEARNLAEAWK